jgi:hypothetical protein
MSELAYRRYHKAQTIQDASPEDALEAALYEMRHEDEPTEFVMIIRAHKDEEGLHFSMTQAGKFNVVERIGLLTMVWSNVARRD